MRRRTGERARRGPGLWPAVVVLVALLLPAAADAAVPPPRQISVDPFLNASGQHETAVEPDSFSFGNTVVATFQLGREVSGGASGIGWATSTDGGTTWRSGVVPALTVHNTPPGAFARVSDPAVAYDRVHGVWLISILALRDAPQGVVSSLVVSRSVDGLSWSGPLVTSPEQGSFAHDKNWIVCDNSAASPFAGRCYVTWTGPGGALRVSTSTDGGLTWGSPTVADSARGSGWQPVVRPDGTLVVVYETERTIDAVRSTNGGVSFGVPVTAGLLRQSPVAGMRAPPLPSVEVDAEGRIIAAWQDCRFRAGCDSGTAPNDIVVSSSANGASWTRVRRVPTAPVLDGVPHFVPGLAVDATTRGGATRLALAFYVLTPRGCTASACRVQGYFVSSADAGRSWSAPEPLHAPQPLDAFPASTAGRFAGDYISTSFVAGGVAVPVFAAASAAFDGRYHQGVFATAVPPLPPTTQTLRVGSLRVTPRRPRAGGRVNVSVSVAGASTGVSVTCTAAVGRARLRLVRRRVAAGRAACTWAVPAGAARRRVGGSMTVLSPEAEVTRRFAFQIGRRRS